MEKFRPSNIIYNMAMNGISKGKRNDGETSNSIEKKK